MRSFFTAPRGNYHFFTRTRSVLQLVTLALIFAFCGPVSSGYAQDFFSETKQRAEQGDTSAQNILGIMYLDGRDVPKDDRKAVEWFQRASENGNDAAQYNLASMYLRGIGVTKDDRKAFEWMQKAADKGSEKAQYDLGRMYAEGLGVPKDVLKAVELYQIAAEQGLADAQLMLGILYAQGDGVPEDHHRAIAWFQMASEQGNTTAQAQLEKMYSYLQENMRLQEKLSGDVNFVPAVLSDADYGGATIAAKDPNVPDKIREISIAGATHHQAREAYETLPLGELKRKVRENVKAAGVAYSGGFWGKSYSLSKEALFLMGLDPNY